MEAPIRELFIDELAEVHGGGPLEDLWNLLGFEPGGLELGALKDCCTTMACGEEASSGC